MPTYLKLINLIQCSKKEYTIVRLTSFHNVNANDASAGLREKLYLLILVPNYGGKIWYHCGHWLKHPWEDNTYQMMCVPPLMGYLLVAPTDKGNITNKGAFIYRFKCDHLGCTVEYISETGRTFGDRYKEHLRAPSPIYKHANVMGHSIKLDSSSIVDREPQGITRTKKEAMFIRVNDLPKQEPWQIPAGTHLGWDNAGYCQQ